MQGLTIDPHLHQLVLLGARRPPQRCRKKPGAALYPARLRHMLLRHHPRAKPSQAPSDRLLGYVSIQEGSFQKQSSLAPAGKPGKYLRAACRHCHAAVLAPKEQPPSASHVGRSRVRVLSPFCVGSLSLLGGALMADSQAPSLGDVEDTTCSCWCMRSAPAPATAL